MKTKTRKRTAKEQPAKPPGVDALLDMDQLAVTLSCSRRNVEKLIAMGRFPRNESPAGQRPKWRTSTVNRWIEATYRGETS